MAQDFTQQIDSKMQTALVEATNEAAERYNPAHNFEAFIQECGRKFIEKKLDIFPYLCEVARMQTALMKKEMEQVGRKGKFTDTYGWSESREWKWEHEIPRELYLFMTNLVYRDFWAASNQHISKKFMAKIINGEDPMQTLMWVKAIYGSNYKESLV